MMHEFCVGKGWCGSIIDGKPSHVTNFVPEAGIVTAQEFVTWLIQADNCDPNNKHWQRELQQVFIKHMGSDAVDASMLR